MTSGCRRYRARRLKALGHSPQLLAIRPAPPATILYHLKPFKLNTALMAVHKDCYATLGLIRQDGPRRRETKNVSLRLIKRSQRGHMRRASARGGKARQRSLASRLQVPCGCCEQHFVHARNPRRCYCVRNLYATIRATMLAKISSAGRDFRIIGMVEWRAADRAG